MAANAVITKVKAMRGRQLTQNDYQELLHKKSVAEIASYLKNETQYAYALKDVRENLVHRGQLENMLRRSLFEQTVKLYRYADSSLRPYFQIFIQQIEIQTILQQIRVLISQEREDAIAELPVFMKSYMCFDLLRLGGVETFDELLDILKKTSYYDTLSSYRIGKGQEKNIAYTECETALYKKHFKHVFDVIDLTLKGQNKNAVKEFHAIEVELSNIAKIYRFKHYFKAREDVIRDALVPIYHHISNAKLESMIADTTDKEFLKRFSESWYHMQIDDTKHTYIEWYMDKFRYKMAKKHVYYSMSAPLVFSSFMFLQKIELENIINIIEGVRYHVDSEDIEKMLIY